MLVYLITISDARYHEPKKNVDYSDNVILNFYGCEPCERIFCLIIGLNYDVLNYKSGVSNNYHCSLSVYKYL